MQKLMRAALCAALISLPAHATEPKVSVDILLVLAADVSGSIDDNQVELQRDGYATALTDPRVVQALRSGPHGRAAVAYVEWSGTNQHTLAADWTLVDGSESAHALAHKIASAKAPLRSHTMLGGALWFCRKLLDDAPYTAEYRVIDVSGDGQDDESSSTIGERNTLVAQGVVINALVVGTPQPGRKYQEDSLRVGEHYYRSAVIGGRGSFVMVAKNYHHFTESLIKKLLAEIAMR